MTENQNSFTAKDLTLGQRRALRSAVYGIEKLRGDFYCQGEPDAKVDGRSLAALYRKGLVTWRSHGGAVQRIQVEATEAGHQIFENELRYTSDNP